jgi:hypothetical protein
MRNHNLLNPIWMAAAFAILWVANVAGVESAPPEAASGRAKPSIIIDGGRPSPFTLGIWTDEQEYCPGQHILIFFTASRDCYIYIFDRDTRGKRRQLFPNYYDQNNFLPAGRTFFIPDKNYSMRVAGPAGTETLDAVAVAERYPIIQPYGRLKESDPFPLRKQGAEPLLKALRESCPVEKEPHGKPQSKGGPVASDSAKKAAPGGGEPQGIIIEPPERGYRYAEAHTSFEVRGSGPEPMSKNTDVGRLRIQSDPSGATVYLDNENKGKTPLTLRDISLGVHVVRLTKPGYEEKEQIVDIDGETPGFIVARLLPARQE